MPGGVRGGGDTVWGGDTVPGARRYLSRLEELAATDTEDAALSYGVVVDCGSSGSRVFVYVWPPHNGNPHDLLDIRQMRDRGSRPVVKKIKPGTCGTTGRHRAGPRGSGLTALAMPTQGSRWRRRRSRSERRPTCGPCCALLLPTCRPRSTRRRRCTCCAPPACGCCRRGEHGGERPQPWGGHRERAVKAQGGLEPAGREVWAAREPCSLLERKRFGLEPGASSWSFFRLFLPEGAGACCRGTAPLPAASAGSSSRGLARPLTPSCAPAGSKLPSWKTWCKTYPWSSTSSSPNHTQK